MTRRAPIALEAVPQIFSDGVIQDLARIVELGDADLARFASGIRTADRIYAKEVREPNANDLHREVQRLESATCKRDFGRVGMLLQGMSSQLREQMTHQGTLPGFRNKNGGEPVTLVQLARMVSDRTRRDEACKLLRLICVSGGRIVEGRSRPSGRKSKELIAAIMNQQVTRREIRQLAQTLKTDRAL